jgi:hypothetical protein
MSDNSDKIKTGSVSSKTKLNTATLVNTTVKDLKTAIRKNDTQGEITTAVTTAELTVKGFKLSQKTSQKLSHLPTFAIQTAEGVKLTSNEVRKLFKGEYKIKKRLVIAPKLIKRNTRQMKMKITNKVTVVRKRLTAPITKSDVKGAVTKTALAVGKTIQTTAIVGTSGMLKTAKVGSKASFKIYSATSNSFSKSNNDTVATTGHMMKGYEAGGKITKTAVVNGYKGAKTASANGVKTAKTVKKTVAEIKQQGFKTTAKKAVKNSASKFVTNTAKFIQRVGAVATKKIVLPIIVMAVLVAGAGVMIATPAMGIAGYLEETLGWLFSWAFKNNKEDKSAYDEIVDKVKAILNNDSNKNQHRSALEGVLPQIGQNNPLNSAWGNYMDSSEYSTKQSQLTGYINYCEADRNNQSETFVYEGYTFLEKIDYSFMFGDFKINNFSDYLVMAFFEKFPDTTAITEDNVSFSDEELKKYLLNWDSFTSISDGQPILKDYVTASISCIATDTIVPTQVERSYIDTEGRRVYYYPTINVTHRSYVIEIIYFPRLKEVSVNPRNYLPNIPDNQELFDKYDFAKDIINNL